MYDMRLLFAKTGRAQYISHLDLMRTMQRAFSRAELPIKYSEGYNPHAVMSIALPLPLFMESECEIMDFSLSSPVLPAKILEKLGTALPEGIFPLDVYIPDKKISMLKYHRIDGIFEYGEGTAEKIISRLHDFFSQNEIVINKKTKRGEGLLDIAPQIKKITFSAASDFSVSASETHIRVVSIISAQNPTLSPVTLVSALSQLAPELAPEDYSFKRAENLTEAFIRFR